MRINDKEKSTILASIKKIAGDRFFELYLFGSRADDSKLGGDIDLLLFVDSQHIEYFKKNKYIIFAEIKKHIGDQKIDITVSGKESIESDTFVKNIFASAVKLFPDAVL